VSYNEGSEEEYEEEVPRAARRSLRATAPVDYAGMLNQGEDEGYVNGEAAAATPAAPRSEDPVFARRCKAVLKELWNHPCSEPFLEPVDRTTPGYYELIKHPMSIKDLKKNVNNGVYQGSLEVRACMCDLGSWVLANHSQAHSF
jgi:hypothetical protein